MRKDFIVLILSLNISSAYNNIPYNYLLYIFKRPSKSDSAPVYGNSYKLRSLKFQIQSQRRDIAQHILVGLVVVIYVMGRSKKFSYGIVRSQKPLQTVPLHNTAITVPLLSTCMIQHKYIAFDSIPPTPNRKH
jgi:hypothetical protein